MSALSVVVGEIVGNLASGLAAIFVFGHFQLGPRTVPSCQRNRRCRRLATLIEAPANAAILRRGGRSFLNLLSFTLEYRNDEALYDLRDCLLDNVVSGA